MYIDYGNDICMCMIGFFVENTREDNVTKLITIIFKCIYI